MDCINCGSGKTVNILNGVSICKHCNKSSHINYYRCENCGEIWRVVDLNLDIIERVNLNKHSNTFKEDVSDLFGEVHIDEDDHDGVVVLMSDYMHRCLMCNAISYEKNENTLCCSKCGFEWEVLSCV